MSGLMGTVYMTRNGPVRMTDEELARAPMTVMLDLRDRNPELQRQLAPFEHRAFTRELTRDNPLLGGVTATVLNGGYELLKSSSDDVKRLAAKIHPGLDVTKSRSGGSWDNFVGGLAGFGQGLGLLSSATPEDEEAAKLRLLFPGRR